MGLVISTLLLVVGLAAIVRAELRSARRSRIKLAETDERINNLAKTTFERHREIFGRDATGTFPLINATDAPKK